jgi:hypothetical protein
VFILNEKTHLVQRKAQTREDIIRRLVDHLRQYPQDLVDAKHLLRTFRVSAREFFQALVLLDRQPELPLP